MKALKIFSGVVLALLLLVLLAVAALVWWVDLNNYKKEIEQLAAKQNVILHIEGDLGWSFYPAFGVSSGKLSVLPPMENLQTPIVFENLNLSVQIMPLFKGNVLVDTIRLQGGNLALQGKGSDEVTRIQDLQLKADGLNLQQQPFDLDLSLRLRNEKGAQLVRDIRFNSSMKTTLDLQRSVVNLEDMVLKVDDTTFRGSVMAGFGATPSYKVTLAGDHMDVDRYTASTVAPKDGEVNSTAGKQDPMIPAATVLAFPGDYDISFQKLIVHHMTLSDMHLVMHVTPDGLMTINPFKVRLYGGDFNLEGRVDVRSATPQVKLDLALSPLQLEPAMKDFLQVEKTFASGDFAFKANITTQGMTTDDFIKALSGNFSFASQAITLNKMDLTSSLDAGLLQLLQVKLPNLMSAENQTVMTQLIGQGALQQGVAKPAFTAQMLCTQLSGEGAYDIPQSGIDYHIGITFPSADENKTCAEINPRLKDIAWPVICKGSMADDPAKLCRADKDRIQAILAGAAKKEVNQKLEKQLDEQIKKKLGEGEDAEQVKNLLKGLLQ